MIIRTITVFDQININNFKDKIYSAADFLKQKRDKIESLGHQLQTTRVSCQLFDEKINTLPASDLLTLFKKINQVCKEQKINFFNPGTIPLVNQSLIKKIPPILSSCENIHCSAAFLPEESLSKQALIAAQLFTKIIELDYKSTFRIGVQANCPELIPFYPA
ncbi:DUF711 family protein, partial [Candidatus Dojkabacteria bacterium]|nr:DUF711 family protein [Candidatus Dojkabacteria bacterium]